MKKPIKILWKCLLWAIACNLGCGQVTRHITLRVVDEAGAPLEGVRSVISFLGAVPKQEHIGQTNSRGEFAARGQSIFGVYLGASKEGHYESRFDTTNRFRLPEGNRVTQVLILPRILNPVPLYARNTHLGTGVELLKTPVLDTWIGYDLEKADWVGPHGKGRVADLRMRCRMTFLGYPGKPEETARQIEEKRKSHAARNVPWSEEDFRLSSGYWESVLEVSFARPMDGVVEVVDKYAPYCPLRLPHLAPEDGYSESARRYEATNRGSLPEEAKLGLFLRTRVKTDADGRIISANYSKFYGDIYFSPRGGIAFWYYFNPRPNDRNLEFDHKANLFPADFPGTRVYNP